MAAKKAADRETDVRGHGWLEEFLLPCNETPSFACSAIGESKKLSREGGGDNSDDRYYEGLDLEDKEFGFCEHSASFRAAQTPLAQLLGRSREEVMSSTPKSKLTPRDTKNSGIAKVMEEDKDLAWTTLREKCNSMRAKEKRIAKKSEHFSILLPKFSTY
jgi:hypothetical protein